MESSEFELAHADIVAGRFDQAFDRLKRLPEPVKNPVEFNYLCGRALQGLTRYDEAEAAFSEALSYRPDWQEALLERSRVREKQRKYSEAMLDVEQYMVLTSGSSRGYVERARMLMRLRQYGDAKTDWATAIELTNAPTAEMYAQKAFCHTNDLEIHEALEDADRAIAIDQDNFDAWKIRYEALWELDPEGSGVECLVAARRLFELSPNDPHCAIHLLMELEANAQNETAAEVATQFIADGRACDNEQIFSLRANAWYELGEYDKALSDYQTWFGVAAKALISESDFVYRGRCYSKLHRWQEAIDDFTTALRFKHDRWTYLDRAEAYLGQGNFQAPLQDLEQLPPGITSPPFLREILGIRIACYEKLGQTDQATQAREQLAALPADEES